MCGSQICCKVMKWPAHPSRGVRFRRVVHGNRAERGREALKTKRRDAPGRDSQKCSDAANFDCGNDPRIAPFNVVTFCR
jgi:hypothetical protein